MRQDIYFNRNVKINLDYVNIISLLNKAIILYGDITVHKCTNTSECAKYEICNVKKS